MDLARSSRVQRWLGGGILERLFLNNVSRIQLALMRRHKSKEVVRLIRKTRRQRRSLQTAYEQYLVHSLSLGCQGLPGNFAEVGVFQGASARLLCETKGNKILRLFDTFEGLPESHEKDRAVHRQGQYAASLESVSGFLSEFQDVEYYPGIFPASAESVPDDRYAFVHLDVDLYQGTLDCLKYFYPRIAPGGIILSHDYSILSGVKDACQEFFADRPERIIELPSTQCMIIKQGAVSSPADSVAGEESNTKVLAK